MLDIGEIDCRIDCMQTKIGVHKLRRVKYFGFSFFVFSSLLLLLCETNTRCIVVLCVESIRTKCCVYVDKPDNLQKLDEIQLFGEPEIESEKENVRWSHAKLRVTSAIFDFRLRCIWFTEFVWTANENSRGGRRIKHTRIAR